MSDASDGGERRDPGPLPERLPYPGSLCHGCAAPPKYVRTQASVFIMCPLLPHKYPRQPVLSCSHFRPREQAAGK